MDAAHTRTSETEIARETHVSFAWIGPALVVLSIAPILLGVVLPVNDRAMEPNVHPFDCDGPATTLIVLFPGVVFAAAGFGATLRAYLVRGTHLLRIFLVLAILLVLGAIAKSPEISREYQFNQQSGSPCH
jgi:hypothetical protein